MYIKERLAAGQCLIGAGIQSYSPEILEFASAGMDWIWWEAQHAQPDWCTTVYGVRTAYALRIPIMLRSWTKDGDTIERLLDTGAEGIIIPMVNTPEQAEEIVSHCYYPPLGIRSFAGARVITVEPDPNEWNKRMVTIMMIETPQAVENAEAIANVKGVDGLLIGATDLALQMGKYIDFNRDFHADMKEYVDHVANVCKKTGKAAATLAVTPETLLQRIDEGYRFICAGMDIVHVKNQYSIMLEAFRKAMDRNKKT